MDEATMSQLRQEYEAWLEECRLVDEANYALYEAYCERRSEAYLVYGDAGFARSYENIPYPPQPVGTHRFNYPRVEANYTPPADTDDDSIPF